MAILNRPTRQVDAADSQHAQKHENFKPHVHRTIVHHGMRNDKVKSFQIESAMAKERERGVSRCKVGRQVGGKEGC